MITAAATVPRLSWSQISTYQSCSAKWRFSRRLTPECTPSPLHFGRAVHHALDAFYTARSEGCRLTCEELLLAYRSAWAEQPEAPLVFGKNEDGEVLEAMAERMLAAFIEAARPGEILAVEQPFAVEVAEGILVSGIVDLVEVKDERLWIVDNKTSKNSPSTAFDTEQVALYLLGLRELGLVPEGADVGLRYDVLRKLKTKGEFVSVEVQVNEKDLADLQQKITQVARAMAADIVYRTRSWACSGCPWTRACGGADLAAL